MTVADLLEAHAALGDEPKLIPMARWVDDLVTVYRSKPAGAVQSARTGCRVRFSSGVDLRPEIVEAPAAALYQRRQGRWSTLPWFEAWEAFDFYALPEWVRFWRQGFAVFPGMVLALEAHLLALELS